MHLFVNAKMRLYFLTVVSILIATISCAQSDSTETSELFFTSCFETEPIYPGGKEAMFKLFNDSMNYPEGAVKQGIAGTVIVQYIVDTFGYTIDIQVCQSICDELDKEAMRLTSLLKGWVPATHNSGKIKSFRRQPFTFVIDEVELITLNTIKNTAATMHPPFEGLQPFAPFSDNPDFTRCRIICSIKNPSYLIL